MAKKKILHILFPEKFFHQYIEFVNQHFDEDEHTFLYLKTRGNEPKVGNVKSMRYYRWGLLFYWELLQYAKGADKIMLHSLQKTKVINFLFLFPRFRIRSCWYLWGGDLYYRVENYSKRLYNPISKFIFGSVVKGLGGIVTHIQGDCQLASRVFGFKGEYYNCFLYPSNLYKPIHIEPKADNTLWILVGNSSHKSNNHAEVFSNLSYLKDADVKIVCPLSYGNTKNAKRVAAQGFSVFGEKFMPITSFISLEEYTKLLAQIDVAIFNHWRQQAVGNIISLLGMGKTVYLRREVTTWEMLTSIGAKTQNITQFEQLELLSEVERKRNAEIIKSYFCPERLIEQSAKVFQVK
jgi:dTDP-N-acetylfucosamine:lipid II N-acetylfucosaminyltransferase